jgi:hypothetical protein
MRAALTRLLFPLAISFFAGCQHLSVFPSDFRSTNLNASSVEEADSIVLAYPVGKLDLAKLIIPREGNNRLTIVETETTLNVLQVIKGPTLEGQIRFRHYMPSPLNGAPGGASGPTGSRGIFFLRRRPDGTFRSLVDSYRPYLPTPWLNTPVDKHIDTTPRDRIARLLLTYNPPDDQETFPYHLSERVGWSQLLTGFLKTFDLLSDLVTTPSVPVRRAACVEMSGWYPLELIPQCASLLAGSPDEQHYRGVAAKDRDMLRAGGVTWIKRRIRSSNSEDIKRYLRILGNSSDPETSALAHNLRRKLS